MPDHPPEKRLTLLLHEARAGSDTAAEDIYRLIEKELRRMARRFLAAEKGSTLQPTLIVDEAFMRLVGNERYEWQDRAHFLATAARAIRRMMVDHARRKKAEKRGNDVQHVELNDELLGDTGQPFEILALNEALDDFAARYPRQAQVVDLRFFAGLEVAEQAEVIGVSERTIKSDWAFARAWLIDRLG